MPGKPFLIVPWGTNFLEALAAELDAAEKSDFSDTLVVFPNDRPVRYMRRMLRALPGAIILPKMLPVRDLFSLLLADCEAVPRDMLGAPDQAVLLRQAVASALPEEAGGGDDPFASLRKAEMHAFLPWGIRLSRLLEDFFMAGLAPADYPNMEAEVGSFAARLLERLGGIHEAYVRQLDERNATTPGYDACRVFEHLRDGGEFPSLLPFSRIILAGFHLLAGTENAVFRHLWERHGATVLLHTDPRVMEKDAHWAAERHADWIRQWGADVRYAPQAEVSDPVVMLYEGYDLHSQLDALREAMKKDMLSGEQTERNGEFQGLPDAVVLPNAAHLMPVLHHLPRKDVNVSLGYPLDRSPLARLVETVFTLQETAGKDGFHWKALLALLRSPYLHLAGGSARPMQKLLGFLDRCVRHAGRLRLPFEKESRTDAAKNAPGGSLEEFLEAAEKDKDNGVDAVTVALGREVLALFLMRLAEVDTLRQLSEVLEEIASLLTASGEEIWKNFPLDAEYLFRLEHHIVRDMKRSLLADEPLDRSTLFSFAREMLGEERVPFEAEPLTGLQVMGMLETRLLRFKNIYLLDAIEATLPGASPGDPLFPESLRAPLGLPDSRSRELAMAHTFQHLIRAASTVRIFYRTDQGSRQILDDKAQRSRFVEEYIWTQEKRRGDLLKPGGDSFLRVLAPGALTIEASADAEVARGPEVQAAIEAYLRRPLSPSVLDAYLRCPLFFYYQKVIGLSGMEEIREGGDPSAVGSLVHDVLKEFFQPLEGKAIKEGDLKSPDALRRLSWLIREKLRENAIAAAMPYHAFLMLRQTLPHHLRKLLRKTPVPTKVVGLEQDLEATLEGIMPVCRIAGRLDRVDERAGEDVILDYKTGSLPHIPDAGFWTAENPLWERMKLWEPGEDETLLDDLAAALPSVQLPVYGWMYFCQEELLPQNASYVDVGGSGEETPLLPVDASEKERERVFGECVPRLLTFLVRHMTLSPGLSPRRGKHCDWCSRGKTCTL